MIGVIFDLDGTLLDSALLFTEIPLILAKQFGVSELSDQQKGELSNELLHLISGASSKYLVIKGTLLMAKSYGIPWYKRLAYLKKAGEIYKERIGSVPLVEGVLETISFLKSLDDVKIGINTTSSREELYQRFADRLEFIDLFDDSIITRSDVVKMKPSPEGILKLSKKWGIPPEKLIMVGDMSVDIDAGKNANCITIGVLTGFSDEEMMKKSEPDFIFENVAYIKDNWVQIIKRLDEN